MGDVMALFQSDCGILVEDGETQRVRIEFLGDDILDIMEEYCDGKDVCIVFTYGSEHPIVYHEEEGCTAYHPCRLQPLEALVRAKRNRVRGCTLRRMNEWICY